jgi:hypothetical protein
MMPTVAGLYSLRNCRSAAYYSANVQYTHSAAYTVQSAHVYSCVTALAIHNHVYEVEPLKIRLNHVKIRTAM